MRNFFSNQINIKWVIVLTLCIVLIWQAYDVTTGRDGEAKKMFLVELFGLFGFLVGFYWGNSTKDEQNN